MQTARSKHWRYVRIAALRTTVAIALSGLSMVACFTRELPSPTPSIAPALRPNRAAPTTPTLTPAPEPLTFTFTADFAAFTLNGLIYDATLGPKQGLPQASLSWHFVAADLRRFNGQTAADATGAYQLLLRLRPQDQIILTASVPGYLPTTVQLDGAEITQYGSRLDFGLVKANGLWPPVPGDVGPLNIYGVVYDAYRGQGNPIAGANVIITDISIVHPQSEYHLTTDATGEFSATLTMHSTDQINIFADAGNYISSTLIRSAAQLISNTTVSMALQPIQ